MGGELSQEEIDKMLNGGGEEDSDSGDADTAEDAINGSVKSFSNLIKASLEEVLKTAFSLEVVSKFIDIGLKSKDELDINEDGVYANVLITVNENSFSLYIYIKKEFASILSDLMMMGPGEAKDTLTDDDLDAVRELLSQVFGNLSSAFKAEEGEPLSFEVKDVKQEILDMPDEKFYKMNFDVAIPNVKSDIISVIGERKSLETALDLKQHEAESENKDEEEEIVVDTPFKDVEDIEIDNKKPQPTSNESINNANLDLIMDVDLDVKIRIGEKSILIKDLLQIKDGSIIELEKNIEDPMEILVNNKIVARGVVVVVDGHFGVKITSIETKEERVKLLGE